ncbi:MAG: tetratricopeptide repeat protein [Anaerolineae bacterium]|nr:tetratricopeptide repeat protein [Anaerolineae bacterium]
MSPVDHDHILQHKALSLAIVKHFFAAPLSEVITEEMGWPVVETQCATLIIVVLKKTVARFMAEYPDTDLAAAVLDLPMIDHPPFVQAIKTVYAWPTASVLTTLLNDELANQVPQALPKQTERAIAAYFRTLREELVAGIPQIRAGLDAMTNSDQAEDYDWTITELLIDLTLGHVYAALAGYNEAAAYMEAALLTARERGNWINQSAYLSNLGSIAANFEKHDQAVAFYQQALTIDDELDEVSRKGNRFNDLGKTFMATGRYDNALAYFQKAGEIARAEGDRPLAGDSLGNLGLLYKEQDQFEPAIDYFQEALDIAQELGDTQDESLWLGNLASCHMTLGRYVQADSYYNQALAVSRENGYEGFTATLLHGLGKLYSLQDQTAQALATYQEALAVSRQTGQLEEEGRILGSIGALYRKLGDYSQALDHFQQTCETAKAVNDKEEEAHALASIGRIYEDQQQYALAIEHFKPAASLAGAIGDKEHEALWLGSLGRICLVNRAYDEAIRYHHQALLVSREIRLYPTIQLIYQDLALAYTGLEGYKSAVAYLERELRRVRFMNDKPQELFLLHELGKTYAAWNLMHHEQAIAYLEMALYAARAGSDKRAEGLILGQLGNIYAQLWQPKVASNYYEQAHALFDQSGENHLMHETEAASASLKRVPYRLSQLIVRPIVYKMLSRVGSPVRNYNRP